MLAWDQLGGILGCLTYNMRQLEASVFVLDARWPNPALLCVQGCRRWHCRVTRERRDWTRMGFIPLVVYLQEVPWKEFLHRLVVVHASYA